MRELEHAINTLLASVIVLAIWLFLGTAIVLGLMQLSAGLLDIAKRILWP